MQILFCNTSEHAGGAAIAASRLAVALRNTGESVQMLVRDKAETSAPYVVTPSVASWKMKAKFVAERIDILRANGWRKHRLFEVDCATYGIDLTQEKAFHQADVIHLHWVNQGLLSLQGLAKILQTGKPLVWTLHDMWPLTGICHHSKDCQGWTAHCGNCPLLRQPHGKDLSQRIFAEKQNVYAKGQMHFVACSDWLAEIARKAPLLKEHKVHSIPNPIDTKFFHPGDQAEARRRLGLPEDVDLLLFVAHKATDRNKGIHLLREALEQLASKNERLRSTLHLIIVGREATMLYDTFAIPTHTFEYVASQETMRDFYRAATMLCMPTLQDNLPNTIVEAMACGTPTVGFRVGGLPQLINHEDNGYLATYMDTTDLAQGITCLLNKATRQRMGTASRNKAEAEFSQQKVAEAYLKVYHLLKG